MSPPIGPRDVVERYHHGTKHHVHAFARSLGYLDWASQPRPFREFAGSPAIPLYPAPSAPAEGYTPRPRRYSELFDADGAGEPLTAAAIGDVLRHALGLSAWKQFGASRWSLRVNPSSGNLHPTEAYVICGPIPGWSDTPGVYHYAPDRHALERRCGFGAGAWRAWADSWHAGLTPSATEPERCATNLKRCGTTPKPCATGQEPCATELNPGELTPATSAAPGRDVVLVALTSIHWREAWKYGERAFRYCQHDLGHAIAAVGFAAALLGWRAALLAGWAHRDIASITGIDRDDDYVDAEREEPGCILALSGSPEGLPRTMGGSRCQPDSAHGAHGPLVDAVRSGQWCGAASQLSEDHVQWTFIDEVARATEDEGRRDETSVERETGDRRPETAAPRPEVKDARALILQRRSAVAFDGASRIGAAGFFAMLSRVMPGPHAPWSALWWTPRIHLALFVHRVDDVTPGLYLLARGPRAMERLKAACGRDFLWSAAHDSLPLVCLARGDCRAVSARLACDQDIAADGFFSLGMIADFDASLDEYGASFYRNLFWETGVVGQTLYLEAEAAGARATGIGCFFDDPVHEVLGLRGHEFQSLYHFTVGMPVEDARLTTERGYLWG